jgi:hypothetical protein
MNALVQRLIAQRSVDRHILDCDDVELLDDAAVVLLDEVAAPPSNALVNAGYYFAT